MLLTGTDENGKYTGFKALLVALAVTGIIDGVFAVSRVNETRIEFFCRQRPAH